VSILDKKASNMLKVNIEKLNFQQELTIKFWRFEENRWL